MAIVIIPLSPRLAEAFPGVVFPTPVIDYNTGGGVLTSAFPLTSLVFPEGVAAGAFWQFPIGAVGAVPAVTVQIDWFGTTAIAGNVFFSAQLQYSFSAGTQNVLTTVLATAATVASAASGGTAFTMNRATITVAGAALSNITASTAIGSSGTVALKIVRDATSAVDTYSGEVRMRQAAFAYQDT